jgi:hypothetical protein
LQWLAYDAGPFLFEERGMKRILIACLLASLTALSVAQSTTPKSKSPAASASAPKLFFVFLNRAPNAPSYSKEKSEEIQAGHMANIKRLYGEGKLRSRRPFHG